jgi:hypothetical protein
MTKKEPVALGAKIITTGIAVSATLGVSTWLTYSTQAKQIDAILEQVQAQVAASTLAATTPAIAPTTPGAAIPVATKKSQGEPSTSTSPGAVVAPTTAAPQLSEISPIQAPVAAPSQPVPTTAPSTSSSK